MLQLPDLKEKVKHTVSDMNYFLPEAPGHRSPLWPPISQAPPVETKRRRHISLAVP